MRDLWTLRTIVLHGLDCTASGSEITTGTALYPTLGWGYKVAAASGGEMSRIFYIFAAWIKLRKVSDFLTNHFFTFQPV